MVKTERKKEKGKKDKNNTKMLELFSPPPFIIQRGTMSVTDEGRTDGPTDGQKSLGLILDSLNPYISQFNQNLPKILFQFFFCQKIFTQRILIMFFFQDKVENNYNFSIFLG